MHVFAWRRRPTRHFGDQWVPFVELSLRSTRGRWYAFSVQVADGKEIVLSGEAYEVLQESAKGLT